MSPDPVELVEVVRTYLELTTAADLKRSALHVADARLEWLAGMSPDEYLTFYRVVGGPWHWRDRLRWSGHELHDYLASPSVHVWGLYVDEAPAGFFELRRHDEGPVELMYFGLARAFMGRGLGGWLLTRAVQEAFALGATRMILNTCTLDAPQALPNYIARGFRILREERYVTEVTAPTE